MVGALIRHGSSEDIRQRLAFSMKYANQIWQSHTTEHVVASVARTLHTYTNTVEIPCDACGVPFESSVFKWERRLIEQAFSLNHAGKALTTILDDAHLMDMANLRQLFQDVPIDRASSGQTLRATSSNCIALALHFPCEQ